MIEERELLEAALDGVSIARDALDKERTAVMARRRNLPIEQQPLDAGYWFERDMALANEMHRIRQALAALDERDK